MSGLDVVYNGKVLVKEKAATTFSDAYSNGASETATNKTISLVSSYTYRYKPSYIVKHVLENSPADLVGIQEGDIILSINGKPAHQLTLKELIGKFKSGHNKKIRMYVQRSGVEMKFQFRLVKKIYSSVTKPLILIIFLLFFAFEKIVICLEKPPSLLVS